MFDCSSFETFQNTYFFFLLIPGKYNCIVFALYKQSYSTEVIHIYTLDCVYNQCALKKMQRDWSQSGCVRSACWLNLTALTTSLPSTSYEEFTVNIYYCIQYYSITLYTAIVLLYLTKQKCSKSLETVSIADPF